MSVSRLTFLLLLALLSVPALLQAQTPDIAEDAVLRLLAGHPEDAIAPLRARFDADPAARVSGGSVAYWLGAAYHATGRTDDAASVWRAGLQALDDRGQFDPRLALRFVDAVFAEQRRDDVPMATQAYSLLLAHPYESPVDVDAALAPYCVALAAVLPVALAQGIDERGDACLPLARADADAIATWWRRQDPEPATLHNEILEEHLQRVAYARSEYWHDGAYDDRGPVYIRLGEPAARTSIQFNATEFRNRVMDRSLTISASDFPDNEFWYYDRIDATAQFIFHNTSGTFRLGDVQQLIPSSVRSGLGNSARGRRKAKALVWTLEQIYQQLSLYNETYATRYTDVASFANLIEEAEIAAEVQQRFATEDRAFDSEGSDPLQRAIGGSRNDPGDISLPGSSFNLNRPDLYVQHALSEARAQDELIAAHREERVPRMRSRVLGDREPLEVRVRTARFLEEDGATRTEIYWGLPAGALAVDNDTRRALEEDGFVSPDWLLVSTVVQQTPDFRPRIINHDRIAIPSPAEGALQTRTLTATGDTGRFNIAVQWDLYAAYVGRQHTTLQTGPRVKGNVYRADSLTALTADAGTLEMSDLKPLIALPGEPESAEPVVFPGNRLDPNLPLHLYFELYHITFGTDDRTPYTVAYEITRTEERRLRRDAVDRTTFSASFSGDSRTAREALMLDLSDWDAGGLIDIVVHITDDISGQQVDRLLSFELMD